MDSQLEKILHSYYFNPSNPATYSSQEKVYRVLNKTFPNRFSLKSIRKWINNQDSYSLQKQARRRFKTPNVRVAGIDDQFEADLASVGNLA